jgi:DNA-binding LacI/PurR family transcriptional regulator
VEAAAIVGSVADLAKVAGVSKLTVPRVLHDAANVSSDARSRVMRAAHSLG